MRIKLSKSDWENIGQKMGWLKKQAYASDYTYEYHFDDIQLPEFPDHGFSGTATITYVWHHEEGDRISPGMDEPEIKEITIEESDLQCVDENGECPAPAGAKEKIEEFLHGSERVMEKIRENYENQRQEPHDEDERRYEDY